MVVLVRRIDPSELVTNKFPVTELVLTGKKVRAKVDTADLPLVLGFSTLWHATFCSESKTYYVYGKKRKLQLHRLVTACPDGLQVDHRDHDGLNNCRTNLRIVTPAVNAANTRHRLGISGYRNVVPFRGKYRASLTLNRKRVLLGDHFPTPELAAEAVQRFRSESCK